MAKAPRAKRQAPQREIDDAASEEFYRPKAGGAGRELTPLGLAKLTSGIVLSPSLQRDSDRSFYDAERREIFQVIALAERVLQANPYREAEEPLWTELARNVAVVRPLVDAIEKAERQGSEYAEYRHAYRFRLMEAMARIAEIIEYDQQRPIQARKDGSRGGRPKKAGGKDAIDNLALECASNLRKRQQREPKAPEVWDEMACRIEGGSTEPTLFLKENRAKIELCDDERVLRSVAKTSFREIFSKLKRKPSMEPGFR